MAFSLRVATPARTGLAGRAAAPRAPAPRSVKAFYKVTLKTPSGEQTIECAGECGLCDGRGRVCEGECGRRGVRGGARVPIGRPGLAGEVWRPPLRPPTPLPHLHAPLTTSSRPECTT